jgi:hypothetical protein
MRACHDTKGRARVRTQMHAHEHAHEHTHASTYAHTYTDLRSLALLMHILSRREYQIMKTEPGSSGRPTSAGRLTESMYV